MIFGVKYDKIQRRKKRKNFTNKHSKSLASLLYDSTTNTSRTKGLSWADMRDLVRPFWTIFIKIEPEAT
jgi:hypothetical protein